MQRLCRRPQSSIGAVEPQALATAQGAGKSKGILSQTGTAAGASGQGTHPCHEPRTCQVLLPPLHGGRTIKSLCGLRGRVGLPTGTRGGGKLQDQVFKFGW